MGRIPQEVVNEIVRRCDLASVIGRYTALKKRGNTLLGLCPFHGEKTPSFNVNAEKGVWYCFGCQEGGDLLNFLMKAENRGFTETVVRLGEEVGIKVELDEKEDPADIQRRQLFEILERTSVYYHEMLMRSPLGREALAYLQSRDITVETITRFRLGWAPSSGTALSQKLEKSGYAVQDGLTVGILRERQGRIFDTLKNRIVFPIWDSHDRVLAFGGRILVSDGAQPKYLNTPETELYSKRRQLYGLNLHRQSISKQDQAVVCEGYLDVIMLDQVGVDIGVASLGTSLTEEQAKLLHRYTRNVTLAYDADKAGQTATVRSIELFEQAGLRVHIAPLPSGEDPDSLARKFGQTGVKSALEAAVGVVDYHIARCESRFDLSTPEGKEDFSREVLPVIERINDSVRRDAYIVRVANKLRISEVQVQWKLEGRRLAPSHSDMTKKIELRSAEVTLFRVCAHYPECLDYARVHLNLEELTQEKIKPLFAALFACVKEGESVRVQELLPHLEEPGALRELTELLIHEPPPSSLEDVQKLLKSIKEKSNRLRLERLRQEIVEATQQGTLDPEDVRFQEYQLLQKQLTGAQ